MNLKTFSPEDAKKMLPFLRSIVRDVTEKSAQLKDLRRSIARESGRKARLDPDVVSQGPSTKAQQISEEVQEIEREVEEHRKEIEALGCLLKDAENGVVDFPSFLGSELVYLCWQYDEPDVDHYHGVREGFHHRKPLPAPDLSKPSGH
jgi:hypothetical protein